MQSHALCPDVANPEEIRSLCTASRGRPGDNVADVNVLPSTTTPICDTRVLPIKTKDRHEVHPKLVCQECATSICVRLASRLTVNLQIAISSQLILTSTTYPRTKPARRHFGNPARMAVVLHVTAEEGSRLWHGFVGQCRLCFQEGSGSKPEPYSAEVSRARFCR